MTYLSMLKPTGHLTLGNLLGALLPMRAAQSTDDCVYGIADLHALTVTHDPAALPSLSDEIARLMLAVGLDLSTLFIQSLVPAHTALTYLLESTAYTGELNRMIQFKEKGRDRPSTRVSLYTYPALMAADILLYEPRQVPVGDDQRQHIELTRDLAIRFNRTYGEVFTVPEITIPETGARVMNLGDPTAKMGKSHADPSGIIYLLDPPEVVRRKIGRAVTDSDGGPDAVRRSPDKPGVSNLIEILTACGGSTTGISSYGELKSAATDAVNALLDPIQRKYQALDPETVRRRFEEGSAQCRGRTAPVLARAQAAMGLMPAGSRSETIGQGKLTRTGP